MGTAARPDRDPGRQAERTRLAWRRTTLAATVVALVGAGRVVAGGTRTTEVLALALVAVGWLAIVAVAHQRIRALDHPSIPDAHRAPAALALLTTAVALAGTLLMFI